MCGNALVMKVDAALQFMCNSSFNACPPAPNRVSMKHWPRQVPETFNFRRINGMYCVWSKVFWAGWNSIRKFYRRGERKKWSCSTAKARV